MLLKRASPWSFRGTHVTRKKKELTEGNVDIIDGMMTTRCGGALRLLGSVRRMNVPGKVGDLRAGEALELNPNTWD